MARSVTPILFRMADVSIERIIAELVDNSVEEDADQIGIRFFLSDKNNDDVGIMVLDNGNGFATKDALFEAMEIQTNESAKDSDDLGKYHIGMKLAPLSRYLNLYLISIIDGKTWISRAFNADKTKIPFDMDDPKHKNPTKPIPYSRKDSTIPTSVHIQLEGLKSDRGKGNFNKPKNCKWTTCVIAETRWRDILDDNFAAVDSMLDEKKFPKHLTQFLGLTYQNILEKNPNLKITVAENHTVIPYDPFLTNFSPSNIEAGISDLERDLTKVKNSKEKEVIESKITAAKALKKFGTLKGATYLSPKFEGLKVTPYHIPVKDVRILLKNELGPEWGEGSKAFMETKVSHAGSNLLKSEGVCGFFFYRNNRLISFGQFYDLNKLDNTANRIRIRIDFPGKIDDHIEVHPNKHKIDVKSVDVWDEVLQGLSLSTGSSEYAIPFKQNLPFFKKGETGKPKAKKGSNLTLWKKFEPDENSHFPNILALEDKKYLKYQKCGGLGGCSFIHEPNDICPLWKCTTCGKQGIGCEPGSCKHKCSHCSKIGDHSDDTCPKLCKACGVCHEGKSCPKACKKCKKQPSLCVCPCKVCGEAQPCTGCCEKCKLKNDDCTCHQGDSKHEGSGPKQILYLFKKNKSENITMIKNAMQNLDITIEDLK